MALTGNPGIVEGADAPDGDTAVDLVCSRLDMAHGLLNTMSNAFTDDGGCNVPDERLRECILGAILIVGEARAGMTFLYGCKSQRVSAAIISRADR